MGVLGIGFAQGVGVFGVRMILSTSDSLDSNWEVLKIAS